MILLLIVVVLVIGALLAGLLAGGATIGIILLIVGFLALIIKLLTKNSSDNSIQVNVDNRQLQQEATSESIVGGYGFISEIAQKENDDKSIVVRFQPTSDRKVPDSINNSLERAYIALNGSQFDEAQVYFDRVLDIDPHFAPAYMGKLLCKLHIRDEKNIVFTKATFTNNPNWDSALRFATDEELSRYNSYLESARQERQIIKDRKEKEARQQAIKEAEEAALAKKKTLKAVIIFVLLVCIGVGGHFLTTGFIIPYFHYNKGISLRSSGQWNEAVREFTMAGKYNDAAMQIPETKYLEGQSKQMSKDWDGAVAAFSAAGDYKDAHGQIPETRYQEGLAKQAEKDWVGAVVAFTAAGDYKDAKNQISETYYLEGVYYSESKSWLAASQAFKNAGDYRDSKDQHIEMIYNLAKENHDAGKYKEAHDLFVTIPEYKDVKEILANSIYTAVELRKKEYSIGNTVRLGHYEQDNNLDNGDEAIEWIVIGSKNDKSLLLSKYALDTRPYDSSDNSSWKNSTLRSWLNNSFLNKAFNEDEKSAVVLSSLNNSHGTSGYYDEDSTDDYVFILSVSEISQYLKDNNELKICVPTNYAVARGADSSSTVPWWTRTRGIHSLIPYRAATYIKPDGSTQDYFKTVKSCCVRPAVWIDLESDYFWRNDMNYHKPYYDLGVSKREAHEWDEAVTAFLEAENYEDAPEQILITRYQEGLAKQADKDWDGAVAAFTAAGDYSDAAEQILITRYQEGLAKQADKDWDGAVAAFTAAGDYSDAKSKIPAIRYEEGKAKLEAGDLDGAIIAFTAAGDYEDTITLVQYTKYNKAKKLYDEGNYVDAYLLFDAIKGYQDSESLLKKDKNLKAVSHEAKIKPFQTPGNIVCFGQYEQDNDLTNGAEPIEWTVLSVESRHCLLASSYCLDVIPFNSAYSDCTWETCTLRDWLNSEFISTAFSKQEQTAILTTHLNNNPTNSLFEAMNNGSDTDDKVFIFNKYEAYEVFYPNEAERICTPTPYAVSQCGRDDHKVYGWWLRSTEHGIIGQYANYINEEGKCSSEMVRVVFIGVRPVMWLDLESKAFK